MYLEEILNINNFENNTLECKSRLNREDIIGWLKTIAGFANSEGGCFVIGVEDKTNKLIGFDTTEADNERNYLNNQINEHLAPRPKINISFISYEINNSTRFIIKIIVEESLTKPVILKYKGIPSIFMRRDGFTNGATYEEIIEMSIKSSNKQYDILSSDIKYDFDKFKDLRKFYKDHNNDNELTNKMLLSLGITDDDNNLLNGATLFLDGYKEKKTEVKCSLFSGFNKGSERIVTVNKYTGNITSIINFVMEFVDQRMNHSMIKKDNSHINVDAYPKRALFEGIINAIAHRDYYLDGTEIEINIFKDRLEIISPGGFYRREKIDKTYDLSGIISKRRNELICNILVASNVMEAAGTGFDKIIEEYKNADMLHKPYISSASDHFTLVLPDLTYDKGIEEENSSLIMEVPINYETDYDTKILSYCYMRARSVLEIARYLGISNSTYLRKQILDNLVKQNYLIKSKAKNLTYYKTNQDKVKLN